MVQRVPKYRGEVVARRILLLGFFMLLMGNVLAIEGVSPGSYEVDFSPRDDSGDPDPGLEREFVFDFVLDGAEELRVEGDLAKYVELDKEEVRFSESVVARLKLPYEIGGVGVKNIWIVAGDVRGLIKVDFGYPDGYVDLKLSIPNANFGEEVPVNFVVSNFGEESLDVSPVVEIYRQSQKSEVQISKRELVVVFEGDTRVIAVGGSEDYEFVFDSLNYSSGEYYAVVKVEEFVSEDVFRLGEFGIEILNYTRKVGGGVSKFEIEVESLSDDAMKEVYAEVRFVGGSGGFDSSIVSLGGWERRTLVGYFDTSRIDEGEVALSIDVYYDGEVESEVVRVYVERRGVWVFWVGGILLVLILSFLGWKGIHKKRCRSK